MAMSIMLVEMALKCFFFFVKSKDRDKATYIDNLMSHSANITSAISYEKKSKPKHIVSFLNSSSNVSPPHPLLLMGHQLLFIQNWDNSVSSQKYPYSYVAISLCSWISPLY